MKLLLDTHIAIWWTYAPHLIAPKARILIRDADRLVSVATIWETAIKFGAGKMPYVQESFPEDLLTAGFRVLPVLDSPAWQVRKFPREKHLDPFDRLILAEAMVGQIPLVTRDQHLAAYGVATVPA